ncbi:MAG: hypothetical protein ACTSR2_06005 [Candidatus Hodarchaeales archaeon]
MVELKLEQAQIEKELLLDFKQYYNEIKKASKKTRNVLKVCQYLYKSSTLPFFDKWGQHFSFIKMTPNYSSWPYYSFEVHLADRIILLPHRAVVYETINKHSVLTSYLEEIKTIKELKRLLDRVLKDLTVLLNWNDIKILKGLTSKAFIGKSSNFPSNEKMASFCGCSRATFERRFDILKSSLSVLYLNYRIDVGKLGYETHVSFVTKKEFEQKIDKDYKNYCLAVIPLETLPELSQNEKYLLVINQIPIPQSEVFQTFSSISKGLFFRKISKSYIGWNLSAIHSDLKQRWKITPPILSTQSWDRKIISEDNGITYNLNPQEYYLELSPTELKLLSLFEKYGLVKDKKLARMLNVNVNTIKETWRRIIRRKLLHRFTFITNIGLDFKPWITILGEPDQTTSDLMLNIVEHLKFFPFTYIFYDTNIENDRSGPIITGLLYMPLSWVNDFFYKFSLLTELGLETQVSLAHNRVIKQNINLLETYY